MTFFLRKLRHRYTHVDNREESYEPAIIPTYNPGPAIIEYRLIACILILGAAVGALALLAGQYILQFECQSPRDIRAEKGNEFHSIKWTLLTFDYNQTFTHAPSVETNRAWDSLFPKGMGYIMDPQGNLEVVGISVFHQLHCLDLLRHLYYAAEGGTPPTAPGDKPEIHPHQHARHCFDYLRQALICAADSTMEPGNMTTKRVTGFGAVHKCRDYDGLVAWTEERRLKSGNVAIPPLYH